MGATLALYQLGRTYLKEGENVLAAQMLFKVIGHKEFFSYYPEEYLLSFIKLAFIYRRQGDLSKAEEFVNQGIELAKVVGDQLNLGHLYNSAGVNAGMRGERELEIQFYRESITCYEKVGNRSFVASRLMNIGLALQETGNLQEAERYLLKSRALMEELKEKDSEDWFKNTYNMARLYSTTNRRQMANLFYQQVLDLVKKRGKFEKQMVLTAYAQHLVKWGEYQKACVAFNQAIKLKDEFFSQEKEIQINRLRESYAAEQREQQIVLLEQEQRIARLSRNLLIVFSFLLILLFGFILKKYWHLLAFWKKHRLIGNYRIIEPLGTGGMGVVYKAHSIQDRHHIVVIKMLREEFRNQESYIQRFKREGEVIDRLNHEHIIRIIERGEQENRLYIVMEYLQGQTLDQIMSSQPDGLPMPVVLEIMMQICDALILVHERGVVHCDLKASNVMICTTPERPFFVKLLDFGLAKVTHHTRLTTVGVVMGTLSHLPPESFNNVSHTPAADIYALGIFFYQMLTGQIPFAEDSVSMLVEKIMRNQVTAPVEIRPDLPLDLSHLVLAMLDKCPEKRPTAAQILDRLQASTSCPK